MESQNHKKKTIFSIIKTHNTTTMKKKMYYLPLILLALFGAIQYGCQEEADEICEQTPPEDVKNEQCKDVEESFTTCCTDNECYYLYKGERYETNEMLQLITEMCGPQEDETSASVIEIEAKLKAQTQKLLSEARADAICR